MVRSIVGVMGSGTHEHDECSRPLGGLIASLGCDLLTGGGGGVMRAVSRAFTAHPGQRGVCIGILPCASDEDRRSSKAGYPNEFVEVAIRTHLPHSGGRGTDDLSRNHINILSSVAIVALPGESGTLSELALALRYGTPVVAFAKDAALLDAFPSEVPRVYDLRDVERFLRGHIPEHVAIAPDDLCALLDRVDIYLLDQLVRRQLTPDMRTLDAGCGGGRNLRLLLQLGFDVCASDEDPRSVESARRLASNIAPHLPAANFRVEPVERSSFEGASFDAIVSSAVLHFARDEEQFAAMVNEMWRLLRRGGLLFCRLASTIGMEERMQPLGGRRFALPDGSDRYLVDEEILLALTKRLGGILVDPLKTTVVQDQRCMTTWVVRKM